MANDNANSSDIVKSTILKTGTTSPNGIKGGGIFTVECRDTNGELKWVSKTPNLVVNVGLADMNTRYFKGSGYTAAWYVGIYGAASTNNPASTDTMARLQQPMREGGEAEGEAKREGAIGGGAGHDVCLRLYRAVQPAPSKSDFTAEMSLVRTVKHLWPYVWPADRMDLTNPWRARMVLTMVSSNSLYWSPAVSPVAS